MPQCAPSRRLAFLVVPLVVAASMLFAAPATADVGPPSPFRRSLELAIGPLHEGSLLEGDELMLSLRAAWRFSNPWAVELSASSHREDRFGDIEATSLELGLRRSLIRTDLVDFFVYGGTGYSEGEFQVWIQPPGPQEILVRSGAKEGSWTAHLGLGVELSLGERWFLRTDLRERYLDDIESLKSLLDREVSISWGRRF